MKNIHLITTSQPSKLKQNKITKKLSLVNKGIDLTAYTPINIYITSDEYIGLSYYLDSNLVRKGVVDNKDYWGVRKDYKKIILTTDQELIKDSVQAIDDEFLEWFVKNSNCEEVEVNDLYEYPDVKHIGYKIIIPKEEPKQEQEICNYCGKTLREQMKGCSEISCYRQFLNKQETLEEAAERILWDNTGMLIENHPLITQSMIDLAKWQAERMFSKEEVIAIVEKSRATGLTAEYLIKQFKNK